jgi:hypothetical protein
MTALGFLVTRAGLQPDAIVRDLKQSPDTLTRLLPKIIAGGSDRKTLVLLLDQMAELFTAQDVEQSNKFLAALYLAAQEKALWVIATIRSDHLQFCHRHPDMLQVLRGQGHYPLGRVEQFMMHDMIVKPANCAGLKVSDKLARRIVNDTGSESANFPLLAFVLSQAFEKRSDHELSEEVYKTLGGVGGAIAEHVKTVEEKMHQDWVKKTAELLPGIFQSLVIVNPEGCLLESGLVDVLELLVEAVYTRNKEKPLRRANLGLEVVRHLWRLAYELKAVAIRQYEHGAKLMDELGRQIGGWLRSTGQSQPNI